jgi:hypothetical protein
MMSSDKVLVYHHRHSDSNPIIPNGLAVTTASELDDILTTRLYPHAPIASILSAHMLTGP